MNNTVKNLMTAFAGESQAYQRYTMYAKIAKKEGYANISDIFEETAYNELHHAQEFYKFLEELLGEENMPHDVKIDAEYPVAFKKCTEDNLNFAANGEAGEVIDYNEMAVVAKEEGYPAIATKFELIANVEAFHSARYKEYAKRLNEGTLFEEEIEVSWQCQKCGHIHTSKRAPGKCPICGHPQSYFKKI